MKTVKPKEEALIVPIVLGGVFEWFEVFLLISWAPIMQKNFFDLSIPLSELIYAVFILASGLIARPLGGIIFGYIGDRWGRKTSFLFSIGILATHGLMVALMPSFASWAYASLIYIGLARFLQGIPAGGELPGALCLLSEGATRDRRRYLCSYLFVGPQIGQILSMLLFWTLTTHLTLEELSDWGWRLCFMISSIIGIIGLFINKFLREYIHESDSFSEIKADDRLEKKPIRESFRHYKKKIGIAFGLSIFEIMGFFMIYFYLFTNSTEILNIKQSYRPWVYCIYAIAITIAMPLLGKLNNRYKSRDLLKLSTFLIIFFSFVLCFAITNDHTFLIFLILTIISILFCVHFSFLPSFIADLFPVAVRFTCIGFSFNIADSLIGEIAPLIGDWLVKTTGKQGAFTMLFPLSGLIFLLSLRLAKEADRIE